MFSFVFVISDEELFLLLGHVLIHSSSRLIPFHSQVVHISAADTLQAASRTELPCHINIRASSRTVIQAAEKARSKAAKSPGEGLRQSTAFLTIAAVCRVVTLIK